MNLTKDQKNVRWQIDRTSTTEAKRKVRYGTAAVFLLASFIGYISQSSANETGIASFYGKSHAGHKTYSEEPFDPRAMTCAHKTLPMQTIVRLVAIKTGNSTVCRINDRGPYVRGRIVDMSEYVAETIGLEKKKGLIEVQLEIILLGYKKPHKFVRSNHYIALAKAH